MRRYYLNTFRLCLKTYYVHSMQKSPLYEIGGSDAKVQTRDERRTRLGGSKQEQIIIEVYEETVSIYIGLLDGHTGFRAGFRRVFHE